MRVDGQRLFSSQASLGAQLPARCQVFRLGGGGQRIGILGYLASQRGIGLGCPGVILPTHVIATQQRHVVQVFRTLGAAHFHRIHQRLHLLRRALVIQGLQLLTDHDIRGATQQVVKAG